MPDFGLVGKKWVFRKRFSTIEPRISLPKSYEIVDGRDFIYYTAN